MSLRPQHAHSLIAGLLGAFVVASSACTITPLGATDTGIAQARAKSPPGADLFGAIVTELIESRRTQFSDAKWTISKCELRGTGEKTRVFLQANPIPTP